MNKYKYKRPIYAIREDSNDSNSNNSDNVGKQEKQLWCICRSEDGARFMICCDCCEEWYHGDCVNITPKQSELISKYFCAQCIKRNPTLKIQYKPGIVKKPKETSSLNKPFKARVDDRLPDQPKFEKPYKMKLEDRDSFHSKLEKMLKTKSEHVPFDKNQSKYDHSYISKFPSSKMDDVSYDSTITSKLERSYNKQKSSEDRMVESLGSKYDQKPYNKVKSNTFTDRPIESSHKDQSITRIDKPIKVKSEDRLVESTVKFSQKPHVKPGCCGECIGCLRKVDCNFCLHCKTKSDKGCLKRMCETIKINAEKNLKSEKLMLTKLPGEFIPTKSLPPKKQTSTVSSTVARSSFPAFNKTGMPSSSSSSSIENISKPQKRPISPSSSSRSSSVVSTSKYKHSVKKIPPVKKPKMEPELSSQRPMKTKFMESSESSDGSMDEEGEEEEDEDMDEDESNESDDDNEESSGSFVLRKAPKIQNKIVQRPMKKKIGHSKFIDRTEVQSPSPPPSSKSKYRRKPIPLTMPDSIKQYKPLECHNIGCTKTCRLGSKYCSDDCGTKLAEQRLIKYLPSRITSWNSSASISNQRDRRTQADIQEECETIQYNLNILDKSHHDLIEFIDRWRSSCSASSNPDDDDRRAPGAIDDSVQCVTCGTMFPSTKALAHMENCYQKIEGGTMVFADFEEQPIGSKLFCDFYDNNIRGYCKRLAALCDHNKDSKVDPKTICAFPLSVNEKSDKVCMTAKMKCNRHVNWERIQRAVIDMNRYRLLVRYEELQVEDRKFKHNIAQRGGVMSLLLHETIDHQPLKPLFPIKSKDRNKKMRKFTKAMCI